MRKQHKDRHTLSLEHRNRLAEMAATKPDAKAAKAFIRKAYECCDVLGYMTKKYDIKGEIGIGQESIGSDKGIP